MMALARVALALLCALSGFIMGAVYLATGNPGQALGAFLVLQCVGALLMPDIR
jgi:hypothetical protein